MLVDLHVYTNVSGGFSLPRAIDDARQAGLDAICVADRQASQEVAQAVLDGATGDFPVFLGVELPTRVGDVLVIVPGVDPFYSREEWKQVEALQRPSLSDVQQLADREGGVVLITHPYDRSRKTALRDRVFAVRDAAGIELATGGADERSNALSIEAVSHAALPSFAGSAARKNAARGRWATLFAEEFSTQEGLVAALRTGNFWPVEVVEPGPAPSRGGGRGGPRGDRGDRGDRGSRGGGRSDRGGDGRRGGRRR